MKLTALNKNSIQEIDIDVSICSELLFSCNWPGGGEEG